VAIFDVPQRFSRQWVVARKVPQMDSTGVFVDARAAISCPHGAIFNVLHLHD
jgi:hypothetical protein